MKLKHKFTFSIAILGTILLNSCDSQSVEDVNPLKYVNPFIGTGGHGHTYPGATMPFGMVQLSPDSRLDGWDGCGGYHNSDSIIYGFSHTHLQGTGISDYADILFMPTGNSPEWVNRIGNEGTEGYCSSFKKSSELASAGYYSVFLDDIDAQVELTAATRSGIQRYSYQSDEIQYISLDLTHRDPLLSWSFKQVDANHIQGYRVSKEWAEEQHVYFYASFSSPMLNFTQENELINTVNEAGNPVFSMSFKPGKELLIECAISAVDAEGAKKNFEAEAENRKSFDAAKALCEKAWTDELSKITVSGGSEDEKSIFYTSLYHSFTVPNVFSDADGRYRGMDKQIHSNTEDERYTVFSLWDTYRATHPLFTITQREKTKSFINGFLAQYKEGGKLPMWELAGNYTGCMIGYHAVPVIVDAYMKGIVDFDTELALEAMISTANAEELGKTEFAELGFIPMDAEHESVSKALEYAYNDWCIAVFADSLGNQEIANEFYKRAQHYKNHFDPSTGFMRARFNGGFMDPFDPSEVNFNFTEANSWQYSFYVPQDVEGLIGLHGSDEALTKKLDELFTASSSVNGREQPDITGLVGQYAHGNEPSHHMAYLYHYTGAPAKSQQIAQKILHEQYQNAPDGLSGNEDCGQMSSWYVLSSLGIYPVCPGSDQYVLCAPIFDSYTINLENGKQFKAECVGRTKGVQYIKTVSLNGEDLDRLYLLHREIDNGGTLKIQLCDNPDLALNPNKDKRPRSKISGNAILSSPVINSEGLSFRDSMRVEIFDATNPTNIYYSLNDGVETAYSSPFIILEESTVRAWTITENEVKSPVSIAKFIKRENNRSISLNQEYSSQYTGGGEDAMIDGLRGGMDFRTGFWQGYYDKDIEAVIDLGKTESISYLGAGFLEDIKPWIWYPKRVIFSVSKDGVDFQRVKTIENNDPIDDYTVKTKEFGSDVKVQARYVKIQAESFGEIPDWHLGVGNPSWLFIDEVVIR